MPIVPTVRCHRMARSLAFYTEVLDFECVQGGSDPDPCFCVLERGGERLFHKFGARGLTTPGRPESPVHEGSTDQTWGTRELYVDDPDGNTLRFIQGWARTESAGHGEPQP